MFWFNQSVYSSIYFNEPHGFEIIRIYILSADSWGHIQTELVVKLYVVIIELKWVEVYFLYFCKSYAGVTKFDNINIHIKILNKWIYKDKDKYTHV